MAIYHLEAKMVSRGTGRSAVAASAYLSCTNILNDYDGVRHDYTRKKGLIWREVFLPEYAPPEWKDRGVLWNAVEENEKTKDSRLAREFVPALPIELTPAQWQELLSDFIKESFVADGMCADVAIHDPYPPGHNPHAHIMLTVRPLDEQGQWQYKTEKEYLCVKDGEERGLTAVEFKAAQKDGWEKQYNISKYANSQNKINMSDFNANDAYHVKMERLSRATPIPVARGKSTDYWFYERARGQYLVELSRQPTAAAKREFKSRCPKNRCISKTVAAKCVMAYQGYPYIVSKGLETSFVYFSDMVSKGEFPEPSEQSYIDMISKVILFNSSDEIIKNLKFGGFKAQQDYYTVALIGKYHSGLINPQEIWNNQTINAETARVVEELAYLVWEHFQNPTVPGVNIGQWCKKEDCWELLQSRYEAKMEKREN